ncbi:hypothetical protein EV190_1319 [Actinorugispora endophytica]|uniref:Uncharacterized protein n=1 Tax=Actinorugispora endophytica TaxID=1605990 RepID=A0A4R6UGQ0_9ACTN|nr:hypothetical protein EV190_1319 [Actinorugispora endophytica]
MRLRARCRRTRAVVTVQPRVRAAAGTSRPSQARSITSSRSPGLSRSSTERAVWRSRTRSALSASVSAVDHWPSNAPNTSPRLRVWRNRARTTLRATPYSHGRGSFRGTLSKRAQTRPKVSAATSSAWSGPIRRHA